MSIGIIAVTVLEMICNFWMGTNGIPLDQHILDIIYKAKWIEYESLKRRLLIRLCSEYLVMLTLN
jgi:hypothetical protein